MVSTSTIEPHILFNSLPYKNGVEPFAKEFAKYFTDFPELVILNPAIEDPFHTSHTDGYNHSTYFCIAFTQYYFKNCFNKEKHIQICSKIESFFKQFFEISERFIETKSELLFLDISFSFPDNINLKFLFNAFRTYEMLNTQLYSGFAKANDYFTIKRNNTFKNLVKKTFKTNTKNVYLHYNKENNDWEIEDILFTTANAIRTAHPDKRQSKDDIVFDEKELSRHYNLNNNWLVETNTGKYFMNKPNDIGIYSSISDKCLIQAKKMFDKINEQRQRGFVEFDNAYYDYFEQIISAIIFAHTTIECVLNMIIPNNCNYKQASDKKGVSKHFDKEGAERWVSMEEKMKDVLPQVLKAPKINQKTDVWKDFIKLKEIRDEIIHSREIDYRERYKKLLDENIFEIVEVHKKVVLFYGAFLEKTKSPLVNQFPFGLGCDSINPAITSSNDFERHMEWIHQTGRFIKKKKARKKTIA